MSIAFTRRLIIAGSIAFAIWAASSLADGSLWLAGLLSAAALGAAAHAVLRVRVDALFSGLVMLGLLIGNRGFAQLSPPNLPLLPAEAALGLSLVVGLWTAAYLRRLPISTDAVSVSLIAWIVVSTTRLPFDIRQFGLIAIRDFATVYYALFFFFAQEWHRMPEARAWLHRCLIAGLTIAPLAFEAFKHWPEVIMSLTEVRQIPLIFIKGDTMAALMAGGAAWCGCLATARRHIGYGVLGLLLLTSILLSNSRAALVALVVLAVWFCLARAWRLLRMVAIYAFAAFTVMLAIALFSDQLWHETEIYRAYERVASIADLSGTRTYRSAALQDKGDNNEFRLTWWALVARQTWEEGRWLGLGFGRELAAEFARIYYPEADESFTARSPHNVVLSVFARSGVIGLLSFLVFLLFFARSTWRAARNGVNDAFGLWLFGWGVFVSACFGVVLEGPMGAVVFWTVLGLANASLTAAKAPSESSATLAPPQPAEESAEQRTLAPG